MENNQLPPKTDAQIDAQTDALNDTLGSMAEPVIDNETTEQQSSTTNVSPDSMPHLYADPTDDADPRSCLVCHMMFPLVRILKRHIEIHLNKPPETNKGRELLGCQLDRAGLFQSGICRIYIAGKKRYRPHQKLMPWPEHATGRHHQPRC